MLSAFSASGQALRDINYNFQYNAIEPFTFQVHVVKSDGMWTVFFNLTMRDTLQQTDQFLIQWDVRKDLGEKEGAPLTVGSISKNATSKTMEGTISIPVSSERQYLTAKVLNNTVKRAWIFYKTLEPNLPVNGYLKSGSTALIQPFIKKNIPVTIASNGEQKIVSYYNDDFPAAVPGFSEGLGRVSRSMIVDSTFTYPTNQPITFSERGLYLIQQDTNATEGFAFRVEEDYPRLSKVESLADPLIYICTKQEFERVKQAKGDKKAFDRVILNITGNTERARTFMRSYFRRVELANQFFTSYKEGWKTDRGMIYIVFGLPDQVYRFTDREVWTYKNSTFKITFDFVKSSTLFDPENFVLVREKKFQETWYEVVDLWRNARF
ncbi:MAG TPA: GWxTD domain-containing protein [Chryseolinea sp.]|nr:GWxTD domain-containing protein [Chryseolinea sp.]